jgi:hypothetical protein
MVVRQLVSLIRSNVPERRAGQGFPEYAVILAMVSTTALVAVVGIADRLQLLFTAAETALPD